MAGGGDTGPTWFWMTVLGIAGFGIAYTVIPDFKKAVNGLFGEFKKGTTINPKEFEKQLPEKDVVPKNPVTAKTGCYNAVANGKAATCWRNNVGGRSVAWCVAGSDRCGYAKAEWCRKLSPTSASCKLILGSKFSYAFYAPFENVTVA